MLCLSFALLAVAAVILLGCATISPNRHGCLDEESESFHCVYIIQRGWHTGIAVRRAEVSPVLWPEKADFADGGYLELGWGDWDFYQAENAGPGMATAAALWSSRSVLDVERIPLSVQDRYPCSPIIELSMPPERFERLVRFIHDSFDRGTGGRVAPLPSSLSGQSNFYPARGRFHLFNNCNTWVLRALKAAGYPVSPLLAVTAASVRTRLQEYGRPIEPLPECSL